MHAYGISTLNFSTNFINYFGAINLIIITRTRFKFIDKRFLFGREKMLMTTLPSSRLPLSIMKTVY